MTGATYVSFFIFFPIYYYIIQFLSIIIPPLYGLVNKDTKGSGDGCPALHSLSIVIARTVNPPADRPTRRVSVPR